MNNWENDSNWQESWKYHDDGKSWWQDDQQEDWQWGSYDWTAAPSGSQCNYTDATPQWTDAQQAARTFRANTGTNTKDGKRSKQEGTTAVMQESHTDQAATRNVAFPELKQQRKTILDETTTKAGSQQSSAQRQENKDTDTPTPGGVTWLGDGSFAVARVLFDMNMSRVVDIEHHGADIRKPTRDEIELAASTGQQWNGTELCRRSSSLPQAAAGSSHRVITEGLGLKPFGCKLMYCEHWDYGKPVHIVIANISRMLTHVGSQLPECTEPWPVDYVNNYMKNSVRKATAHWQVKYDDLFDTRGTYMQIVRPNATLQPLLFLFVTSQTNSRQAIERWTGLLARCIVHGFDPDSAIVRQAQMPRTKCYEDGDEHFTQPYYQVSCHLMQYITYSIYARLAPLTAQALFKLPVIAIMPLSRPVDRHLNPFVPPHVGKQKLDERDAAFLDEDASGNTAALEEMHSRSHMPHYGMFKRWPNAVEPAVPQNLLQRSGATFHENVEAKTLKHGATFCLSTMMRYIQNVTNYEEAQSVYRDCDVVMVATHDGDPDDPENNWMITAMKRALIRCQQVVHEELDQAGEAIHGGKPEKWGLLFLKPDNTPGWNANTCESVMFQVVAVAATYFVMKETTTVIGFDVDIVLTSLCNIETLVARITEGTRREGKARHPQFMTITEPEWRHNAGFYAIFRTRSNNGAPCENDRSPGPFDNLNSTNIAHCVLKLTENLLLGDPSDKPYTDTPQSVYEAKAIQDTQAFRYYPLPFTQPTQTRAAIARYIACIAVNISEAFPIELKGKRRTYVRNLTPEMKKTTERLHDMGRTTVRAADAQYAQLLLAH